MRIVRLERLMMRGAGMLPAEEPTLPGVDFEALAEAWKKAVLNLIRLVRSYEPQPYRGVLTVFRQEFHPIFSSRDPADGWGDLATGGIIVINARGRRHTDMLEPPEAEKTAWRMMRLMDLREVQARQ